MGGGKVGCHSGGVEGCGKKRGGRFSNMAPPMKLAVMFFLLACALGVHGQEKGPQPKRDQKDSQGEKAAPPPTIGVNVVSQQTAAQQENRTADHPRTYLSRLFSPENLPSIGLLLAGIGGICVAIRTLKAVERQVQTQRESLRARLTIGFGESVFEIIKQGRMPHVVANSSILAESLLTEWSLKRGSR